MTANQLSYWRLVEDVRHNRASEDELRRHQLATENIDYSKYAESARHNLVTEAETNRTNVANESIRQYANIISQQEANAKDKEAETHRQLAQYQKASYAASANESEAKASYSRTQTGLLDTYGALEAATNIGETQAKTWNLNVSSQDMENKSKSGYWEAETAYKQEQAADLFSKNTSGYWPKTLYNDTFATGMKGISDLTNAFKNVISIVGMVLK